MTPGEARKRIEKIYERIDDLFGVGVFDGPPRAFFELATHRGIYKVWGFSTTDRTLVPELFDRLTLFFEEMRDRGATSLFWRRHPDFVIEDDGVFRLTVRLEFLDMRGESVPWPANINRSDGLAIPLIPS